MSENNPSNLFPLFAERTWHNIFIGVCLESCLDWRQNAEWNLPKWKKRLKPKLQHFRRVKCCLVDADETFCIVSLPQEIFNTWPDLRTQEINEPDCPAMTLAPGFHLTKINFTSGFTRANHSNTCRSIFRTSSLKCFQLVCVWPDQLARKRRSYRWCFGSDGTRKLLLAWINRADSFSLVLTGFGKSSALKTLVHHTAVLHFILGSSQARRSLERCLFPGRCL